MAVGADAVIIDLEDSISAGAQGAMRARARFDFLKSAQRRRNGPRLLVRINGLDTGMTDADLAAIVPGRPDAILFPKAEGGASLVHLDAKLTAQEAIAGIARRRRSRCWRRTSKSSLGLFMAGTFRGVQPAPDRHDLGPGGSVRRTRRRSQSRRATACSPSRIGSPARSACSAPRRRRCRRSRPSMSTSATPRACAARRMDARRDGFTGRLAIHPAQVPVINEVFTPSAGADRKGEGGDRRVRRAARRRRCRHRRQDVRPAASGAGATVAGEPQSVILRCERAKHASLEG